MLSGAMSRHPLQLLTSIPQNSRVVNTLSRPVFGRTQFYEYSRRFQTYRLEALKNPPTRHRRTTTPEVGERVLNLSLERPTWGCAQLSRNLKLDGIAVSSTTLSEQVEHDCSYRRVSDRKSR